jgi:diacylglycerol kinase (ATP)
MRSFTAILNPISGGGHAPQRWAPVRQQLEREGAAVETVVTRNVRHAKDAAAEAVSQGRTVVAVGGDGLLREIAPEVMEGGGHLGLIPAGRGNGLAAKLSIPDTADMQAQTLLGAPPRAIDVLEVNGRIVLGNAYAGLDSVANIMLNNSRIPSAVAYQVAPVLAIIRWKPAVFEIDLDGTRLTCEAHFVVAANTGRYGHGLRIAPDARMDDGLFDLVIVGAGIHKTRVASFMKLAQSGSHVHDPDVQIHRGRDVRFNANRPLPLCFDGDQFGDLPATVTVRPAALWVIAPLS